MKENSLIKKLQNELDIRNKELQDLIDKQTELEEHINYLSNVKNNSSSDNSSKNLFDVNIFN